MSAELNLAETLIDDPSFAIFVKALALTDLLDKLSEAGPFTIMAPPNAAFARLSERRMFELMRPINKANLTVILKYHIVEGKWSSQKIAGLASLGTLHSQSLRIEATNLCFTVNGANLHSRDIETANGTIHVVKTILFPAIATASI